MAYGVVYKAQFPSGLVYIGQTNQKPPSKRWEQHMRDASQNVLDENMKHFHRAIAREGAPSWSILEETDNAEMLDVLEAWHIKKHDATNPKKGYNSNAGKVSSLKVYESAYRFIASIERRAAVEEYKTQYRKAGGQLEQELEAAVKHAQFEKSCKEYEMLLTNASALASVPLGWEKLKSSLFYTDHRGLFEIMPAAGMAGYTKVWVASKHIDTKRCTDLGEFDTLVEAMKAVDNYCEEINDSLPFFSSMEKETKEQSILELLKEEPKKKKFFFSTVKTYLKEMWEGPSEKDRGGLI